MASRPRNFQAFVPVAITVRFTLRLPLLAQQELRELMLALFVRYAEMCAVEILWYDLGLNHLHITVMQAFDEHDSRRRLGISPLMRNTLSAWTKHANAYHSTQGRLTERTFRSHNITSNEKLLANQAYTLGNKTHHTGTSPVVEPSGAWNVYARSEPDGVVSAVPDYVAAFDCPTDELLLDIIWRAVALERSGTTQAWLEATLQVLQERSLVFPSIWIARMLPVSSIVDPGQHQQMVEQWLAWEWTRIEFHPRAAPQLGQIIDIVVRKQLDAVAAFG